VIQPPDRVGADACNECEPAHWERPGAELHRLAPDADEQQRKSVLRLRLGEPLASAGAPQRELLQRDRRAAAP
jgi:hypothetical protein